MTADELAEAVASAGRAGFDDFVGEVALDVAGEAVGRVVPAGAVLFEGLQHDPIEFATHHLGELRRFGASVRGHAGRGFDGAEFGCLDFADDAEDFQQRGLAERLTIQRRRAGQQLVQQHAERIHVAAGVDVEVVQRGLLRGHVLRRADDRAQAGVDRVVGKRLPRRLGHAEVDHLRHRLVVVQRNQHVARLDVPVDDPLLVGVLNRQAHGHEQFQASSWAELALVAILRNRHAFDQLHHKERSAVRGQAAVEHLGNVRVVHHGRCLPLRLESRQDLLRVHPPLDELDRHPPLHGFRLVR